MTAAVQMAVAADKTQNSYAGCSRCILTKMDDPAMTFNEQGLCNHCRSFDEDFSRVPKTPEQSRALIAPLIEDIKAAGKNKPYDCIIGVSGGVDSTYLALVAKRLGLRPLAVHFDNGWNSELAVDNIERMLSSLQIDLMTYVIDWEDFRRLQIAYLKASVIDIEALTDHAIYGALYKIAAEKRISYILSGINVATEAVLVETWIHDKLDFINIKDIFKKCGDGLPLRNYPFVDYAMQRRIKRSGIKIVRLLDMMPYDIAKAKEEIKRELGWREYEGKHFESIFTRFYQGYILPKKFGVDKRKAHLSNLICSGQMKREDALREIQAEIYPLELQREDREFVVKKLKITDEEFAAYLSAPQRRHNEYDNYRMFFRRYPVLSVLRPLWTLYRDRNLRRKEAN